MSLVHADALPDDPVFIHSFGVNALGMQWQGLSGTVPVTGTFGSANRLTHVPIYLAKPYRLARWFWLNGATIGTDYIQMGIYDQDFRLRFASPRVLNGGTVNQVNYVNPGVHIGAIDGMTNGNDANNYDLNSAGAGVTLRRGELYLLAISNAAVTSNADPASAITGTPTFPGTWVSRGTVQFNGAVNRLSVWSVVPTDDWTGVLTVFFGGVTQSAVRLTMYQCLHVDTATNHGVVQAVGGSGSSTTPLATLAAFGSVNNATLGIFSNTVNIGYTPSAGWQEIQENTATISVGSAFRSDNDTTVDVTQLSTGPWGAMGVEVKSKGTGPFWVPAMRGYMSIFSNGTTSTVFRKINWTEVGGAVQATGLGGSGLPDVSGPSGTATVVPVYGFTRRPSP